MLHLKIILLVFLSLTLNAEIIEINSKTNQLEILSKSKIYIDKSQKLSFHDIQTNATEFIKNDKKLLGFGYDPQINIWIKFTLKNDSNKKINKVLEYSNSLTTNIKLYSPDNEYKRPIQEGLFNIRDNRKTIKPSFNIHLDANESKTFYIQASSDITTLIVKLTLYDNDKFYQEEIYHQSILALFFGAMFILAFYNIFIYFFTRDVSYLYYVLYIFGTCLHHSIYTGISNVYFSQEFIKDSIEFSAIIVALPIVALALFTKYFLQIDKYRKSNIVLNGFLVLIPISLIFFSLTDGYDKFRNTLTLLLMLYLVYLTIYASIKRNKQAYFILFGWTIIFLAILFMVLSSVGIFNIYQYFPYLIEVSFASEAVVFSIALANRINSLQKEKDAINQELISRQKHETKILSKKVEEKTKDLQKTLDEKELLLKELNHRVKNNMQTIVSLIRLQSDEIEDEKMLEVLTTIQNRVNAMSHLHELLYRQDNISHINAYEYFEMLIEEVKYSYEKNIDIDLNIQTDLEIEQAIYCGLILNELITNSFKYAFPDDRGEIEIKLYKENNCYILIVEDNGIGYKEDTSMNSLGLILVNTLVKDQLEGDIKINSKDGVKTYIKWEECE